MPSCVYNHQNEEKGEKRQQRDFVLQLVKRDINLEPVKDDDTIATSRPRIIRLGMIGLPSVKLQSGPNVQSTGINKVVPRLELHLDAESIFTSFRVEVQFFNNFIRRKNNGRQYCYRIF